jgi:zinc protease
MLSITGDIESREAKILIDRYLGNWTSPEGKPETPPLPRPPEGEIFFLAKEVPQSIVIFGCPAPAKRDAQYYTFEVLDFIVGSGGFRSRIFQEIRTNLGLAYSTGSFYNAKSDYGLFGAYALTKSESTVKVTTRIRNILREMGEKPVPPEELKMARAAILNSFIFSFTSAEQIAFQKLMIEYEGLSDDFLVAYRSKIGNVRADAIRDTALRYLAPGRAIILIIGNDRAYQDISANFGKVTRIEAAF